MMTIENRNESGIYYKDELDERNGFRYPIEDAALDAHDRCMDVSSSKSDVNTDLQSSSRTSDDTKLDMFNSESERSGESPGDDTPDSPPPVYRPTTEPIEREKKGKIKHCCGCGMVSSAWRKCRRNVADFNTRQWRMLVILCLGTLSSSLSVCLFPPFFPKLAESKGESATMYGMVIGTNCLTAFLVTPIIGKNMDKIGVNFGFTTGMVCSGTCCILSGFLQYFNPGFQFVTIAILIRVVHATSNAAVITSSIAFISSEFPNSVAFLFSLTRATMNLAQMVGPALGGALHDAGGFKMPFFVLGSSQVVISIFCAIFLPQFLGKPKEDLPKSEEKSIWLIVRIPGIWIAFITFIFSTMSNGFLSITLEPRVLRKFNISPLYVGILFGLKDGANCIASPVWGWMCDRMKRLKLLIIVGSVMASFSFILLGPFPGLPIQHTMFIIVFSLILNGFGVGGQQVAGVISAMKDTVNAGFPDEPETHAFVAGLWSSLSGAGRFISRAGSGILVDTIGFQMTSTIVTSLHLFILVATSLFICFGEQKDDPTEDGKKRPKNYHFHVENSPSEPAGTKSRSVSIPVIREDLEGSFMIGSTSSRISRR